MRPVSAGERPFKCRLCGRKFTTKGNLKTHISVHLSGRLLPAVPPPPTAAAPNTPPATTGTRSRPPTFASAHNGLEMGLELELEPGLKLRRLSAASCASGGRGADSDGDGEGGASCGSSGALNLTTGCRRTTSTTIADASPTDCTRASGAADADALASAAAAGAFNAHAASASSAMAAAMAGGSSAFLQLLALALAQQLGAVGASACPQLPPPSNGPEWCPASGSPSGQQPTGALPALNLNVNPLTQFYSVLVQQAMQQQQSAVPLASNGLLASASASVQQAMQQQQQQTTASSSACRAALLSASCPNVNPFSAACSTGCSSAGTTDASLYSYAAPAVANLFAASCALSNGCSTRTAASAAAAAAMSPLHLVGTAIKTLTPDDRLDGRDPLLLQRSPAMQPQRLRLGNAMCSVCDKRFACRSALEIHMRSHTGTRIVFN